LVPAIVASIANYPEAAGAADAVTLARWRETYQAGVPPLVAGTAFVTDKRPDNFLHVGLIKRMFPRARIVHSFRNPLDNILSLYFLHLDPGAAYALDLDDAVHWYRQYVRVMAHWDSLYPGDILHVDYDALVRSPKAEVGRLLTGCGLPWEDGVLDFANAEGPVKTASVWQVREPLHPRSSGRWRNYEKHLGRFEPLLAEKPDWARHDRTPV
jgi:hypothetical protein